MYRTLIFCLALLIPALSTAATPGSQVADRDLDDYTIKMKFHNGENLNPAERAYWDSMHGQVVNKPPATPAPRRDDRGGPDDFGYRWVDSNEDNGPEYEWIEINEIGQGLAMGDDDNQGNFDIGFDFPFYDEVYEQFRICSNGFITFGDQFLSWDHQNHSFPEQSELVPMNVIAPLWMDLVPQNGAEQIFYWTNDDADMLVVEWDRIPTYGWDWYNGRGPKTFEVILHSNGQIYFQYADENNPTDQGVIGIQNEDGSIGLTVSSNAEYLEPGLAVRIGAASGWLTGSVTDLATGEPVGGATVTLSDNSSAESDEEGVYWLNDIQADPYTATAFKPGYNYVTSDEFEIADQETTTVDFELPHPEIRLDVDAYMVELPQQGVQDDEFNIFNDGNGELEYGMYFTIPVEGRRDPQGDILYRGDVSAAVEDENIRGFCTDGNNFYFTGSAGRDEPNYIYVFDREGEYLYRFEQPIDEPSDIGMRGLASDGNYLYGSDGPEIVQFNNQGEAVATIPSPFDPARYIAWDPETDHFWVAERIGRIYEIDREGNILTDLRPDIRIYGFAWHPEDMDGFNLYILNTPGEGDEFQASLLKVNPENGEIRLVMNLFTEAGDEPRDLKITNAFNPLIWMGLELVENNRADVLTAFEIELNTNWVEVNPMQGTIDPESSGLIDVVFRAGTWMPGTYELVLVIENNTAEGALEVPLTLSVSDEGLEPEHFEFIVTDIVHRFTINSVELRGVRASYGDEIGIFTPNGLCVGASLWFDQVTTITAYGDDPNTDFTEGFTAGQAPSFTIYDVSAGVEFEAEFTRSSGDENFTPDGFTRGTLLVAGRVMEQIFDLGIGWSVVSSNLILDRTDIEFIFAGLVERGSLIIVKDGAGRFYVPDFGFGDFEYWDETQGYMIKMEARDSFTLSGEMQAPDAVIPLHAGWNLIAYLPSWAMPAPEAFAELGDNLIIAKDGLGNFYIPAWDFSNMGDLSAGNGYLTKVNEAAEFHYPQAERGAALSTTARPPQHVPMVQPTDNNMSLLIKNAGRFGGMDVVVRDASGRICGAAYLSEAGATGLAIWGDDPTTPSVDGALEDQHLTLEVTSDGVNFVGVEYIKLAGELKYDIDGMAVISLQSEAETAPAEFYLTDVYPNPFNDQTMVEFGLPEAVDVSLRLYDVKGSLVSELINGHMSAGCHAFNWQPTGLASGTYLMRLEAGSQARVIKVVMLK